MIIKTKFDGYARDGARRLYLGGKDNSPPQAPDPALISRLQTQSNLQTANANAALNRVNQNTPWGSLNYTRTPSQSTFDQAGYDKAMQDWQGKNAGAQPIYGQGQDGAGNIIGYSGSDGAAPSRDQFTTPGTDQWTANVTLSPEQQALLDQQNRNRSLYGQVSQNALNLVGTPVNTSGMTAYRDIPQGGGAQAFDAEGLPTYVRNAESQFDIQNQGPSTEGIQYGLENPSSYNSMYSGDRQKVEDAIYSRLNPQLQRDRAQLDQRLVNQGIVPGSEAYNNAIQLSDQKANDARMQAVLAGGQEQSRLFGMGQQAGQFVNQAQAQRYGQQAGNLGINNAAQAQDFAQNMQNAGLWNQSIDSDMRNGLAQADQAMRANQQNFAQQLAASQAAGQQRGQQFSEGSYQRGLGLSDLNALQGGNNLVTSPQFSAVPQANVAGTNDADNYWRNYQGQMNNYNADVAGNNSMMSGLFSLGSAALPLLLSDRRAKRNINRIGTLESGLPWYSFEYLDGTPSEGVMADEVARVLPEAVHYGSDGLARVDYSML